LPRKRLNIYNNPNRQRKNYPTIKPTRAIDGIPAESNRIQTHNTMPIRVNANDDGWRVRCGPWRWGVKWAGWDWMDWKLDIKGQWDNKGSPMQMPVEIGVVAHQRETGLGLPGTERIRGELRILVRIR
jgi:hypothetical protein